MRGSIPARAGEPRASTRLAKLPRVYPPRVRGNLQLQARSSEAMGSIPARAGEPWLLNTGGDALVGLSPRVRGNLQNFAFAGTRSRFRLSPQ